MNIAGREVVYDRHRWELLTAKRSQAGSLLEHLGRHGFHGYVYGSVARGDVELRSDVDVFVRTYGSVELLEELARSFAQPQRILIVQATPSHTPKCYIYFDPEELFCLSFPLAPLSAREEEFYRFGGLLSYDGLRENMRVPGVNKKLLLIYPTREGHIEAAIRGREGDVARLLGISLETVLERAGVLTRRALKGRTGVYLKYSLRPSESIPEALNRLASSKPPLRRLLSEKGVL